MATSSGGGAAGNPIAKISEHRLSALDSYYWPRATHMLRGELKGWRTAPTRFDPSDMLTWLGLSLDQFGRSTNQ